MSLAKAVTAKLDIFCLMRHLAIASFAWLEQQMCGSGEVAVLLASRRRRSTGGRCWRGWIGRWPR